MRRVNLYKYVWNPEKKYSDKTFCGKGNFIAYGVDYEEFETGPGNYTVGVIEMDDGTVRLEPIHCFEFISVDEGDN